MTNDRQPRAYPDDHPNISPKLAIFFDKSPSLLLLDVELQLTGHEDGGLFSGVVQVESGTSEVQYHGVSGGSMACDCRISCGRRSFDIK